MSAARRLLLGGMLGAALAAASGGALAAACASDESGDWSVRDTWGTPATGCAGAPGGIPGVNDTVTISNLSHTVTVSDARVVGSVTFTGGNQSATLEIQGGGSLRVDVAPGSGDLTINAPSANNRTKLVHVQSGATLQVDGDLALTGGANGSRISEVRVEAGATLTVLGDVDLNGNARSTLTFNGASTFNLEGDMDQGGSFACAACTLNLRAGGNQDLQDGFAYFNVVDQKTGGEARFIGDVTINGSITDNGRLDLVQNDPVITLAGSGVQAIGGSAGSAAFSSLIVDQGVGGSVTLGHPLSAAGTLTFTAGIMSSNGHAVSLAAAAVTGGGSTTSYLVGCIAKAYAVGNLSFRAGTADEFPIGLPGSYLPVAITAGTTTSAGTLTVCVTAGDHPQVNPALNGTIDTTKSVNRYWSLTNAGLTSGTALDAIFKFSNGASEYDVGATPANFIVERYDGALWNPTNLGTVNATSTEGENSLLGATTNDFAIGEPLASYPPALGTFNAFDTSAPAGAIVGNIQTKQAGVDFTVRLVRIANNAINTGYGTNNVTAELYDASDNSGAYANGCRSSWTAIAGTSQLVDFNNGLASATFNVPDFYRDVRVRIVKTGGGSGSGCSNDRFAIRPQSITVSGHDATWRTAGTGRALANIAATGGNVHAASVSTRPFTLRAVPLPTPTGANTYDGSPTVASGFPACCRPGSVPACAALPATCTAGALALGAWSGTGTRENADAHYSEAGVMNLRLEDSGYAAVDAADGSSLATRTIPSTATVRIGRFVPDRFVFAGPGSPAFRTYSAACSAARSFTYIGQPFWYQTLPSATVTAVNAAGNTTTNYRDGLFALDGTGLVETYSGNGIGPSLSTSLTGTPVLGSPGNGTATYSADPAGVLAYARSTASPIPADSSPFTANISLSVSATDASEAAVPGNPGNGATPALTSSSPLQFNAIAFDSGALFRYGRVRLLNAVGSERLDLPVGLRAEYWTGSAFATNTADNCTAFAPKNFVLSNPQGGVVMGVGANMVSPTGASDGNVGATAALSAGVGSVLLLRPNPFAATPGSVDICLDLDAGAGGDTGCQAATPADRTWLQAIRTNPPNTFTQDPAGRAAFGLYGAQPGNFIFFRENF